MKRLISANLIIFIFIYSNFSALHLFAQTQPEPKPEQKIETKVSVTLLANTAIEVATSGTVTSAILVEGSLMSFDVIKPVVIDNKVVIEKGALATAKVVKLKRGGFWGSAGKIGWELIEVTAVDGKSIPVVAHNEVKGEAKEAEARTKAVVSGALLGIMSLGILAPLGLLYGFKKGKNVTVPAGTRFRIFTKETSTVEVVQK